MIHIKKQSTVEVLSLQWIACAPVLHRTGSFRLSHRNHRSTKSIAIPGWGEAFTVIEIILIGNIVQVEVKQACGGSLIFYRQRHELLLKIERYSCRIRIYREESAACLVVGEEVTLDEIYQELYNKTQYALSNGLKKENIIIDVGFGFAKTAEQNFTLLKRISEFKSLGYPILAGVSRKRFLQDVVNTKEPKNADIQTALATSWFIQNDIEYIRVHDVELSMQALKFNDRMFTFN